MNIFTSPELHMYFKHVLIAADLGNQIFASLFKKNLAQAKQRCLRGFWKRSDVIHHVHDLSTVMQKLSHFFTLCTSFKFTHSFTVTVSQKVRTDELWPLISRHQHKVAVSLGCILAAGKAESLIVICSLLDTEGMELTQQFCVAGHVLSQAVWTCISDVLIVVDSLQLLWLVWLLQIIIFAWNCSSWSYKLLFTGGSQATLQQHNSTNMFKLCFAWYLACGSIYIDPKETFKASFTFNPLLRT